MSMKVGCVLGGLQALYLKDLPRSPLLSQNGEPLNPQTLLANAAAAAAATPNTLAHWHTDILAHTDILTY